MIHKRRFARRIGMRRLISTYSVLLVTLLLGVTLLTGAVSAADSDLDPSFDGDGIVTTNHGEFEELHDIVIQPDGKIVAVGFSGIIHGFTQEPQSMMVVRYNADGSPDFTFGSGGVVTTDIGTYARAWAVALQTDGKILVGGRGGTINNGDFALVRYNPNGSLDNTFGNGGIIIKSFGAFSQITDVAVQSDGKIVVAGDAPGVGSLSMFTVARYNTNGSLDTTFDGDGVSQAVPDPFPSSPTVSTQGLALQMNQKIVVVGACVFDTTLKFCASRYNSNGSLDNTFDNDGLVTTDFDATSGGVAKDVKVQPDGKIVVAGQTFTPNGVIPALARYNSNGSLDPTFDGDGRVTTSNSIQLEAEALELQSNGKIVLVGRGFTVPVFFTFLTAARYNSDGSLDNTFGSGGFVTTFVGNAHAFAVAVQTDGRIVVGGYGNLSAGVDAIHSDFALVRYGTVVGHPPVVTITGPPSGSAFAVNTPVSFTGTFTDDPGDTHVVEWFFQSTTEIIAVPVLGSPPGSANTTHTFTAPGIYKVSLRVTDNNSLSTTVTTVNGLEAFVVIFDPIGGWVSGGGWIDSPPGAFALMPTVSGRVNFGFVSRYQNGANVPTGNTDLQFNAANMNFQSSSYEWLVISGAKAQCRGIGTINGSGSYRFLLTVIDGDQPSGGEDKFRIRIWSDTSGLIYDNQFKAPDSADPTTVLGGGNISIQH